MVQERSRAAAAARVLAWALTLAAAWLLLALVAPTDRASAQPVARDLGSLVGDTVDDALGAVDAVGEIVEVTSTGAVDAVAEAVVDAEPAAPAITAPAPAAAAPAVPAAPTTLPSPAAPAPVPAPIEPPASATGPASATSELASAPAALLPLGSLEHLADTVTALLGPVGQPVSSILAPAIGAAAPVVDPVLGLIDRATAPVVERILPPLVDVIDGVDALPPPVTTLQPPGSVSAEGTAALPATTALSPAGSVLDRSARGQAGGSAVGDSFASGADSSAEHGGIPGLSGATSLGAGIMPSASAAASSSASAAGVFGVVGSLIPLALLRGSIRRGATADGPVGPAREHAPSPD